GVDLDGAFEGARGFVEPPLMKERDREPEVRRGRRRVELDRAPRGGGALRHGAATIVAEGELEVRRRVCVLVLETALESTPGVARMSEMIVRKPEIEVGARVLGMRLQHLEAAVAHTLGEVELQLATFVDAERGPAVLAVVVVGGVLDAALGTRPRFRSAAHAPSSCFLRPPRQEP